jgi:hypothetical protein
MDGYFHRDIVEQIGPALVNGTGVLLRQVSVFTPTDMVVGGTSKRYLNIIPRNVEALFVMPSLFPAVESLLEKFNHAQTAMIQSETTQQHIALENHTQTHAAAVSRVLAPAEVRTTTSELTFISQRQVVQRHQPVRSDAMLADGSTDDHRSKKGKKKNQEAPTGLGRWQWHQLAQKKKPVEQGSTDEPPAVLEPSRRFTSGRFTELLSQHIQAKRYVKRWWWLAMVQTTHGSNVVLLVMQLGCQFQWSNRPIINCTVVCCACRIVVGTE